MYSVNGYRRYSRDVDNAFNIIPSDRISMKGVDFPVIGVDEFGIIQFMQPEKEYQFPGNTVFEVPIMERGGWLPSRDKVKAENGLVIRKDITPDGDIKADIQAVDIYAN